MTIREPECVTMKRRGADYVAELLLGKSREEELEFWRKRTKRLRSHQMKAEYNTEARHHISRR